MVARSPRSPLKAKVKGRKMNKEDVAQKRAKSPETQRVTVHEHGLLQILKIYRAYFSRRVNAEKVIRVNMITAVLPGQNRLAEKVLAIYLLKESATMVTTASTATKMFLQHRLLDARRRQLMLRLKVPHLLF